MLGVECATPVLVLLGVTITGLMPERPEVLIREFCWLALTAVGFTG